MLSVIKNKARSFLECFPPVTRFLCEWKFKTELALLKGTRVNSSRHPSIIHFSYNKAATQYVKSILNRCAVENGMVPVGVHDLASHSKVPYLDQLSHDEMKPYQHIFKVQGYL
jgi:hypothetical protein